MSQHTMTGANGKFADQLLGGPTPTESKSDCGHCVMLPKGEPAPGMTYFDAKVRCCTYEPTLPNYMAGAILRDRSAENEFGRRTLIERMDRGIDTLPWGVRQSAKFSQLYSSGPDLFGRAAELSCPHLREGDLGCSIWKYRPGVCSTWHCKHDRGAISQHFWALLALLLREAEDALSLWCVSQLHPGEEALTEALRRANSPVRAEDLGAPLDRDRYAKVWGTWAGREVEFYEAAAALTDSLSWSEVEHIAGVRVQAIAKQTVTAYQAAMSPDVPAAPKAGPFHILQSKPGKVLVESYSRMNPLWMTDTVMRMLPYFDGRTTDVVLEEIREKEGVRMHGELVRKLADFGILQG